ncbi:hypothetical protein FQN50_000769 [Emmonsiellopsis sp. PD_5]|nr:hypothetical protein FQN50_000769 [Emmonsiellopsis sp. PD_5]
MSSFFSPKSKAQRTSLPSNDPEQAVQSTGYRGFGGRSTFSKMRKKRPPPINISVENGNVFINGANPDAKAPCRDLTWLPSSPQTPHGPGCMHPTCREGEMFLLMSPPFSSFCGGRHSCATPTVTSNCQSPTSQYFPAELPGSMMGTVGSSELDALSTPIKQSYETSDDYGYGTPPDLTYSPYQNSTPRQRELEPAPLQPHKHNSIPPPDIDFWELLEILPNLSPDEIKMHWRPAMLELAPQIKSLEENRGVEREARDEAVAMEEPSHNQEDLARLESDFAARLDAKEEELSELHHLHNSHLDLLCTFISKHLTPELAQPSDDPEINEINILLANRHRLHHRRRRRNSEQEQQQPNRDHSTPITARAESTSSNNPFQSPHPPPARQTTHPNPNQNPTQHPHYHHHQHQNQQQRHLIHSLREKDAQISILNTKVAQLLMMSSPNPNPSGTAVYRHSAAVEARIEKDLPSPGPGGGAGFELGQTETDWYADGWGCGWDG